ncbi:MAG TPA: hypothetical protein VK698_32940 [Kofleriaceae bacterium]|nr:hypothetical protein [Kofleriaceae bacterium]
MILVVVDSGDADRVSEALRAGLGLGLRGDPVAVVLTGAAARFAGGADDPRIERALRTLAELGRPVEVVDHADLAGRIQRARAVEVWTSGGRSAAAAAMSEAAATPPVRRLRVGGAELEIWPEPPRFRRRADGASGAIDAADLLAQILASDGPIVVS